MTKDSFIFVVDDDASARNGLVRMLRAAGHEVYGFASANDFFEALDPGVTGCLVLDVRMLGMSSDDVYEELNVRSINLSIIFVTGDDDPETKRKAVKMNAAGFFRKPVDGPALLDAIHWALEKEQAGL